MNIFIAQSDVEIASCFPVMCELRPKLNEESFVARIRKLQQGGYHLAYLQDERLTAAVAGFRFGESLAWGKYLYVDDLVTLAGQRSRGLGAALLSWLLDYAQQNNCDQFHLDSGVQRKDAHRFYEREGLQLSSYHFVKPIPSKESGL